MKAQYLIAKMPDGSEWDIAASYIALHRARHHAEGQENPHAVLKRELDAGLSNPDLLLDWARNDMDWSDVAEYAYRITRPVPPTYSKWWPTCDLHVISEVEA